MVRVVYIDYGYYKKYLVALNGNVQWTVDLKYATGFVDAEVADYWLLLVRQEYPKATVGKVDLKLLWGTVYEGHMTKEMMSFVKNLEGTY